MDKKKQIMEFDFETSEFCDTHFHQNLEILYVLEGVAKVQIEDDRYEMIRGDFLLVNANKKHSLRSSGEVLIARFSINYGILVEYLGTNQILFWCNTVVDKNEAYDHLRQVLDRILNRYFEKEEAGTLYLNSLYFEALYLLTSYFIVKADDSRIQVAGLVDNSRIFEIQNYVQSNYQKQISLNDLAKQLYLSNAYLSKYIKKRFGLSFLEYLNNVRLFHGVDELLYTDKKIIHVALDNGFPTTASFNKAFKNAYDMTPSAYRDKIRQEQSGESKGAVPKEIVERKVQEYFAGITAPMDHVTAKNTGLFKVDARVSTKLTRPWGKVVNLGDALLLLRSDVQEHVLTLKKELGFSYIRIWNVFDPAMYHKEEGNRYYNFSKLDKVLDFLTEHGLRPFLELSFKPNQVISSNETLLAEHPHSIIFDSRESYLDSMNQLASHLVNRYGMEEIEQWYFELWKDPRMHMEDAKGWYYENFEIGYEALKKISPKIQAGGAGFLLGYENYQYRDLIKIWKRRKIRPDFISVYAYRYVTVQQDGVLYGKKSLDYSFIKNQLEVFKQMLREEEFDIEHVYISEWNFTISNRNYVNDSCAQGAYIMKNCIEEEGSAELMAYWHGTDLYSEYYDTEAIVNGDSGLLTQDGIKKPSFYAFHFLNFLQNQVLGKNEYSMVTANGRGNYTIVCHNSKKMTYRYAMKEENEITIDEIDEMFEDLEPVHLNILIDHVENGDYLMKVYYINRVNGSVQDAWREMEFIKNLSPGEISYLKRSSMPHVEMRRLHVEDGILRIETKLLAHEIRALDIYYQY